MLLLTLDTDTMPTIYGLEFRIFRFDVPSTGPAFTKIKFPYISLAHEYCISLIMFLIFIWISCHRWRFAELFVSSESNKCCEEWKAAVSLCVSTTLKSAILFAQTDQSRRFSQYRHSRVRRLFMQTGNALISLHWCAGWSESSLFAHAVWYLFAQCKSIVMRRQTVWKYNRMPARRSQWNGIKFNL